MCVDERLVVSIDRVGGIGASVTKDLGTRGIRWRFVRIEWLT